MISIRRGNGMGIGLAAAGLVMACAAASAQVSAGQTPASQTPATQAPPAATHAHKHSKSHPAKTVAAPPPAEVHPPAPPPPNWPANSQAQPAAVAWNGHELSVAATNSSLQQILRDVSTATGVKVDGLTSLDGSATGPHDQRIYGSYGPAPARDVLRQLLDGSGYNVIMVGDRGQGTPRELLLTTQVAGSKSPAKTNQSNQNAEEEAPEEPEPEPQPDPNRRFNGQPGQPTPGRTPQQMLQEIQQRQQQQQQNPQQQQQIPPQQQQQQQQQPGTTGPS
jgi:hypothetical protein